MYDWLERAASLQPDRIAVERSDEVGITYSQLLQDAAAAARRLAADGVSTGERVPVTDRDRVRFAVELHGAMMHGAAAVPIDPRLGEAEQSARAVDGVIETPDIATVMHTSGTTSAPKPVHLTHANWEANAIGSAFALGLDPAERWLCVMPLAHVGGLSILLRSTLYATTVVVHERFDVGAVVEDLMNPERAITLVSMVPTMLSRALDAGLWQPLTLRWVLLGGGPIPPALLERAQTAGVPVAPSYGMTEACSQIATFGFPLHRVQLRLEDSELLVRGPIVAPNTVGADGWLRTGDLAEFDHNRRLRIIGRKADTIVTGGENVAPSEIEAVLMEHPTVADAAVFGRPDLEWGEAVVAWVVPRDGSAVDPAELRTYVGYRLARFKVPKEIDVVRSLPRTPSGKLLRRQLM